MIMLELTAEEQKDILKKLKANIRDALEKVDFPVIEGANEAVFTTDKKGFREVMIEFAIECEGNRGFWEQDKIYAGSMEDNKSKLLFRFNRANSLIMLSLNSGIIMNIAKSGSLRVDPPWTKQDGLEIINSWLQAYLEQ